MEKSQFYSLNIFAKWRQTQKMRKKRRKKFAKLGLIFIILLLALSSISVSHSLWTKDLEVELEINTGSWDGCIKIRKNLRKRLPK